MEKDNHELEHYLAPNGRDPVQDWLDGLADKRTRAVVIRRLDRLSSGNFGDAKFCRDGVWELRIDVGPGYRVYYAQIGKTIVLLLSGGDKRNQHVVDIARAVRHWQDWQRRQL